MGKGLSITTIKESDKVPYALYVGTDDVKALKFYEPRLLIDAGSNWGEVSAAVFPVKYQCENNAVVSLSEYNLSDKLYYLVENFLIPLHKIGSNHVGYPLVVKVTYVNINLLKVIIRDGKNNNILVNRKVYIRRKGQNDSEMLANGIIKCTGTEADENAQTGTPYALGFVRYRSNHEKRGNRYEHMEFVPCKPYFEQAVKKNSVYGQMYENFTHVDRCENGTPVLEIAEYSEKDYVMQTVAKLSLSHTKFSEMDALSPKGKTLVGVSFCYEDMNTLFVKLTEKSGLRKYESEYVLDIDRQIVINSVPIVPSIPVDNKMIDSINDPQVKNEDKVLSERKQNFSETNRQQKELDESLMAIYSLAGLRSVKKRIEDMTTNIKYNRIRSGQLGVDYNPGCPRFFFTGNPGTGKTTVARLLASVYKSAGLLSKGHLVEADRKDLCGQYIGETAIKTHNLCQSAYGGVLFIDEAYELRSGSERDYGHEAISALIAEMENHRSDFIVIMAGYTAEMYDLLDQNTGLRSRITDFIEFPDYTEDELCNIARIMAGNNNYTITDDGMAAFRMCISKKMVDKKFGNGRDVRNLVGEAMERHGLRYMDDRSTDFTRLTAEDFGVDLNLNVKRSVHDYLDELDAMVGLDSVKKEIHNAINRASYMLKETKAGNMSIDDYDMNMNLCFTGNPGTGKTSVARLYAKILYAIGFTKTAKFVEATREDFVGGYQGQTAIKTKKMCECAYGGVLFIDEAYSLVTNDGHDEFGKEALATLIKQMEDNRKKLVVIFAGYTKEMEQFMNCNSGLKSRISKFIEFEDYSADELMVIFDSFANKGRVILDSNARPKLKQIIQYMVDNKDRNFGNAREIRNLYESVWSNMVSRVEENNLTGEERRIVRSEDIKVDK